MAIRRNSCLNSAVVRDALRQAWADSQPASRDEHEEGGFVLREADSNFKVIRWLRGLKDEIQVPPHAACKFDGDDIAASFHTHPNTGDDYLQEPSETDKQGIKNDEDLKGQYYEGEFVISHELIYLVTPNGMVREIGETEEILVAE